VPAVTRQPDRGNGHVRVGALLAVGALTVAGLNAASAGHADAAGPRRPPPLYLGLDSFMHLGQLSYLEVGDRVGSQTAADRGGCNAVVRERVLLRGLGPGLVTSLRMRQDFGSPWQLSALLVLAAVVLGTMGWPPALHVFFLQWRPSVILIATALTECVAVAVSLADSRPRPHLP
jgi:hypothetical protein